MLNKKLEVKQLIETLTEGLNNKIETYTKYNQPINILSDSDVEVLHACLHDTYCGGSGGSGWDTVDNGESKSSSHIQSKFCSNCHTKLSFFVVSCYNCGNKNFKASKVQKSTEKTNPRDARWGISSTAHIKHFEGLKEYRLLLQEPETDNPGCRKFRLRYWTIDKNSEHLNGLAEAQNSQKSKGINFQPLKKDFYLSGPVLKFDGWLTVDADSTIMEFDVFDLSNTTPETIPGKYKGLSSKEIIENKKYGKARGLTTRG